MNLYQNVFTDEQLDNAKNAYSKSWAGDHVTDEELKDALLVFGVLYAATSKIGDKFFLASAEIGKTWAHFQEVKGYRKMVNKGS
jgi:hypothetical protein